MGKPIFTQAPTRQNDKQSTSKNPAARSPKKDGIKVIRGK